MINHLRKLGKRKYKVVFGNSWKDIKYLDEKCNHIYAGNLYKNDCVFYVLNKSSKSGTATVRTINFYYFNKATLSIYYIGYIQADQVNSLNEGLYDYNGRIARNDITLSFIPDVYKWYDIYSDNDDSDIFEFKQTLAEAKKRMISLITYQYIKELKFFLENMYLT